MKAGRDVDLAVFDKAARRGQGDIAGRTIPVRDRKDLVFFEGWCLGLPEASAEELAEISRRYRLPAPADPPGAEDFAAVLVRLRPYRRLWGLLDLLVMLQPDSPGLHEKWRLEQENDLAVRSGSRLPEERVREMVRLFLPFTYLGYKKIIPDVRLHIDRRHRFYRLK